MGFVKFRQCLHPRNVADCFQVGQLHQSSYSNELTHEWASRCNGGKTNRKNPVM